jgi:hypothetical protein
MSPTIFLPRHTTAHLCIISLPIIVPPVLAGVAWHVFSKGRTNRTARKTHKATFSGRTITHIYTSLISGTTRGRGEDSHIVAGIMGVCLGWN